MKGDRFKLASGVPSVDDIEAKLVSDKRLNASGEWARRWTLQAKAPLYFPDTEPIRGHHQRVHVVPITGHLDSMFQVGMDVLGMIEEAWSPMNAWSAVFVHGCVVGLCKRTTFHFFKDFQIFSANECGYPVLHWDSPHFEEFYLSTGHEVRGWKTEAGLNFISHLPITLQEKGVFVRHVYGEALGMVRNNQVPIIIFESSGSSNRAMVLFVDDAQSMKESQIQALRRLHYLAMMVDAGE